MTTKIDDFNNLFRQLEKHKENVKCQKKLGHNNFSLLNTVLKADDEVRLHSRFISSMLDPQGNHFQDSTFLKLFLDAIGKSAWMDADNATVASEIKLSDLDGKSGYIDIYISDGVKHIIIENKINAKDQHDQLRRYIDQVYASSGAVEAEEILFIYLSKGRERPDDISFHNKINADKNLALDENKENIIYEKCKTPRSKYLSISFNLEILKWIDLCVNDMESKSIQNLIYAFSEYRIINEKLNKKYTGNIMSLIDYLDKIENENIKKNFIENAEIICNALPEFKAKIMGNFIFDTLLKELKDNDNYLELNTKNCTLKKELIIVEDSNFLKEYFTNSDRKRPKDQGLWYAITSGTYNNRLAFCIFLGKVNIHIGFVPILEDKGNFRFYESKDEVEVNPMKTSGITLHLNGATCNVLKIRLFSKKHNFPWFYSHAINADRFVKSLDNNNRYGEDIISAIRSSLNLPINK